MAKSFDGTNKAVATNKMTVEYAQENARIPSRQKLRARIEENATDEAKDYLKLAEYRQYVEGDAADLTEDEWHARRYGDRKTGRLGTIGASSASRVMGVCPYEGRGTNLDLYHEVLGDEPAVADDIDPGREHIFMVGHRAEEFLRKKMEEYYPGCRIVVDTRIFADKDRPWLTTNLDFMMQLSDGAWIHGEFKTTNGFSAKEYDGGAIPPQYKTQLIQCQHLLNVDESRLVCAVMKPQIGSVKESDFDNPKFDFEKFVDDIIIRTYIRDLDDEYNQIAACDDFWMNHVLPEIEPEIVGKANQVNSAIRRWKGMAKPSEPAVQLPDVSEQCRKILAIQKKKDDLNAEIRALEAESEKESAVLKQIMGQATIGLCSDPNDAGALYKVEFKPTKGRTSFKSAVLQREKPQLYNELVSAGYVVPAKAEAGRIFKVSRTTF